MNTIIRALSACCLLLQVNLAHAETEKDISYSNQREEVFDLENWLKETTYTTEKVKDTCTRQVPYQENVCNDVTKYKKECKTVPAHEECKDVNHPICHNETHMEEECHTPTRNVCHMETTPSCHNETRYDNVCSDGPSRQQCRTVYEPSCHYETRYDNVCETVPGEQQCRVVIRYHEECSQSSGQRQCHQVPPDIKCHIVNGENKCEKIPAHEECSNEPGGRECHQAPYEERECSEGPSRQQCRQVSRQEQICNNESRQECTTVPGEQSCRQVPRTEEVCSGTTSHQVCEDVPGDEVCRQIPKVDQVCVDHMEKECKNIPAKDVCKNVPYQEQVCKMETKYKDENYECTKDVQVPHVNILKTHKAHVQMLFDAKSPKVQSEFVVSLNTKGSLAMKALAATEDSNILAFVQKDVKSESVKDVNSISALYKIALFDKAENFKFTQTGIQNLVLHSRSVEFVIDGKIDLKRTSLAISISKKGETKIDKTIKGSQLEADFDGEKTKVIVDLEKFGTPKLGGFTNRKHDVHLKLKLDYSDLGEAVISDGKELSTEVTTTLKVD